MLIPKLKFYVNVKNADMSGKRNQVFYYKDMDVLNVQVMQN